MKRQTKNSERIASLSAIALLCVLALLAVFAVPLDNTASFTMAVNVLVVALTCLYYWQPVRAARAAPRIVGKTTLLAICVLAFVVLSCLTSDDWRELLNQRLHITGSTPAVELLYEWGLLLLMLSIAFLARAAFLRGFGKHRA